MELKTLVVAVGVTMWLSTVAYSAEEPAASPEEPAKPVKCLKAVVNPVTGFAICVDPKGAKVEPPPPEAYNRPCKPRAHDDDPWTVYEHASGC